MEIVPQLRTEHLEDLDTILGDFHAHGQTSGSQHPIISCVINNTLVMRRVFSFNGVVGERTREGLPHAPIIL